LETLWLMVHAYAGNLRENMGEVNAAERRSGRPPFGGDTRRCLESVHQTRIGNCERRGWRVWPGFYGVGVGDGEGSGVGLAESSGVGVGVSLGVADGVGVGVSEGVGVGWVEQSPGFVTVWPLMTVMQYGSPVAWS
jgi:hypothetical protein